MLLTDWTDEEKMETNILRLIYQGRFLHGNVTLGALQLPAGKTTVMHLVARENLPEPNNRGEREFASRKNHQRRLYTNTSQSNIKI